MGTSDITVTSLTATATLRGTKLVAAVLATGPAANIPSLMLANIEFYGSTTNVFSLDNYIGEGNPDFLHSGLIEEKTYYYWSIPRAVNGSKGAVYPASPTGGVACTAIGMSGLAFGLANGKIVASVVSDDLIIALKTASGDDPSEDDPVYVAFENSSGSEGGYSVLIITAALSLTVLETIHLGTSSGKPFALWAHIMDNGGTPSLAIQNSLDMELVPTTIYPLQEGIASSSDFGTAPGALYGDVLIDKPTRAVARLEWSSGLAARGVWTAGPDRIELIGPLTKRPGEVVQEKGIENHIAQITTTTTIPWDDTIPQDTEGVLIKQNTITPKSKANIIFNEFDLCCTHSVATEITLALFDDGDGSANALAASWGYVPVADAPQRIRAGHRQQALKTTLYTFTWRAGGAAAGTFYANRVAAGRKLGGVQQSSYRIVEFQV